MPLSPLVIRFGRLGDALLLQPLLRRLHARYGEPCRLLAAGAYTAELYQGQPDVVQIMALRSHHRPLWLSPEQWRIVSMLRRMRDVPVYVCEPRPRALKHIRLLLTLAGIPASHCVYLTDIPYKPGTHWIDHLLQLADATPSAFSERFAHLPRKTHVVPEFTLSAQDRADCDQWLQTRGYIGRPLVLLQPANKRTMRWRGVRKQCEDDKAWPAENWSCVATAIHARLPEARILICGSPAEMPYLRDLYTKIAQPNVDVVANDLSIARLKALLAVAHSMISVDSGPAHIAAAMGCPLVVMFGAVSPSHWRPRSHDPAAVLVLGGPPASHRVDAIAAQQVVDAWRALPPRTSAARATLPLLFDFDEKKGVSHG